MDWLAVCSAFGALFAGVSLGYAVWILRTLMKGGPAWIWLGVTSASLLFAMVLGMVGAFSRVNTDVQRVEQYALLLFAAASFAVSGVKLYDIFVYHIG